MPVSAKQGLALFFFDPLFEFGELGDVTFVRSLGDFFALVKGCECKLDAAAVDRNQFDFDAHNKADGCRREMLNFGVRCRA